jgi:hypothetical protein
MEIFWRMTVVPEEQNEGILALKQPPSLYSNAVARVCPRRIFGEAVEKVLFWPIVERVSIAIKSAQNLTFVF